MKSIQRYENGTRHATRHIGGGSDHELARLFAWLIVLVVAVGLYLYINGTVSYVIDRLVWLIIGD